MGASAQTSANSLSTPLVVAPDPSAKQEDIWFGRAKFPHYGYNDLVDLEHKLVIETLAIKRLHAILGMSMGGMHAWQWAQAYPDAVEGVMPVVSCR